MRDPAGELADGFNFLRFVKPVRCRLPFCNGLLDAPFQRGIQFVQRNFCSLAGSDVLKKNRDFAATCWLQPKCR